jgi:2-dehydro-3-deoxyglucarate aldolase
MGQTKKKLRNGQLTLGGWVMIGHPSVAEIYAGEGFDWICVDMEHTSIDAQTFQQVGLGVKGSGCDLFARLHSCDPVQAKLVLDAGANGIIVPMINSGQAAAAAVAMAKFPPEGDRGASLCRASDFGRRFDSYFHDHNEKVCVIVMLEHIEAVKNVDEILSVPGVDGTFIGPYDLSSSMGLAGQLDHPDVQAAQKKLLEACKAHKIPAGLHVVPVEAERVAKRVEEGYTFIACGADTQFLIHGCQAILEKVKEKRQKGRTNVKT